MADASTSAFLSGQGIPVALSNIESELSQLWGPAAEREGGADVDRPTVTRVALANLVVIGLGGNDDQTDAVLDTVVARYPCRAIVLRRQDGVGRKVVAEITALCHLPAPGMPQVCSERILLTAGKDGLDLLPGAVRPLLEADLPLIVWWKAGPEEDGGVFQELAKDANRVAVDLPDPIESSACVRTCLDLQVHPFARDLAWFGITPWRELAAQFFDPIDEADALKQITSVTIEAATPVAGSLPRVAAWFGGWLAGQLGWTPKQRVQAAPDKLLATFEGPSGEVAVTFRSVVDAHADLAHLLAVSITAKKDGDEATYRLVRLGDGVGVEMHCCGHTPLPRMVHLTEFDHAGRVSALLESARDDPPYRNALPQMLWILNP